MFSWCIILFPALCRRHHIFLSGALRMAIKSPKILSVEEEFDESFEDVVRGFAEMGYSQQAVAQILEFNRSYFRELLRRMDLTGCFLPQRLLRPECRGGARRGVPGPKRPGNGAAQKYTDEYLLRCVAAAPTTYELKRQFRIDPQTIRNRFGSWKKAKKHSKEGT